MLEISNPMIEDAETVKLLVLAERAKQIARGMIFLKFLENKLFTNEKHIKKCFN